jgi:hypothetical protein
MRTSGRRDFKTFRSLIVASCYSCRQQGGPMNCVLRTDNTTGGPWHYINWPFKPEGQPPTVETREPDPVNILTALAENKRVVTKETDPERRAIALAWLFHLVATSINRYTRRSPSLLTIPTATEAGMKSVYGWRRRDNRWTCTGSGMA